MIYAQRSPGSVIAVNGLQTVVRIVADLVLSSRIGYIGLAVSAAVGLAVQLVVLGWLVRRRLGPFVYAASCELLG